LWFRENKLKDEAIITTNPLSLLNILHCRQPRNNSLVPAFVCQQMSHRTQSDLFIEGHNTNEQNQGYGDQSFEPFRLP